MKTTVEAIIFIPFCENDYEMMIDTIHSIQYHVKEKYHIIAVDDCSTSRLDEKLKHEMPDITVLRNQRKHGGRSGLYVTQAIACKHALKHFSFKILIKIDTDALMVGSFLATKAIHKFEKEPKLGILGSYKIRADGIHRQWLWWRLMFLYESSQLRKLFKKPVLWKKAITKAKKFGYDLGENILGGCYILNNKCIEDMHQHGFLDYEYENVIAYSKIGDEIIYSLFCKAAGYDIGEFGKPEDCMVIALDVVPMSKENIISESKSVIHSVKKGLQGESQSELREYFKSFRV